MTKKTLAIAALALSGGCSSFDFEPTSNWWAEGGRLCAVNREDINWTREAPRSCLTENVDMSAEVGRVGSRLHLWKPMPEIISDDTKVSSLTDR